MVVIESIAFEIVLEDEHHIAWLPRGRLNIKMSYQYMDPYVKDKTVVFILRRGPAIDVWVTSHSETKLENFREIPKRLIHGGVSIDIFVQVKKYMET